VRSPALRYTTMRITLFVGSLGILVLLGLRGFASLAAALVLSGVLSYFLLGATRDAMGRRITRRISGWGHRIDAGARAEDDPEPPAS